MLRIENVTLSLGTKDILVGASLHVHPGERCGVVGPNGAGKTTLLRLLLGGLEPEHGAVHRRAGAVLGYLPQQAVSGSTRPVWDEVQSQMTRMTALRERLERAQADVEASRPGAVERLDDATEAWRLAGGFALDQKVGEVLHGLGFEPSDWQRTCDTFSGGWQMRIALARLLLSDPDVLLLDEPTNHLDIVARSWLSRFLATLGRTLVIVSHDRWLLDTVCNRTIELRHGQVESFRGNLSAWLKEREQRAIERAAAKVKQEQEIDKLERFVERFGAKASKASQAQSKQKALDRIERIEDDVADARPRLRLPEAPGCSQEMIELRGVSLGWEGGPDVLKQVELLLVRGQRVAILGPNGAGKSTLLHGIAGTLLPRAGRRKVGKDVRIGLFEQDLASALPTDRSPLDVVQASAPLVTPQRIRAALGALGLKGDYALRPIGGLSGGERARVVLASFAVVPYNLLLLDEPTNHLDAVTVDVLVEALAAFEGAMIMVSHDRFLVERVATHIVRIEGDRAVWYEGVRPELLEPASTRAAEAERQAAPGVGEHEERKRRQRERTRLQRQLDQRMGEAEKVERDIAAIDDRLAEGGDWAASAKLSKERTALEAKMEALFEEMAGLETQIGALGA